MAPTLVLTGLGHGYDGEYDIPAETNYTMGELRDIRRLSGVVVGTFHTAGKTAGTDLLVAIAYVVLKRAGHAVDEAVLWAAGQDSYDVTGIDDQEEDEDRPPATATTGGASSEPAVVALQSESSLPSGEPSGGSGENQPAGQSPTGDRGSGDTTPSGQETSPS